MPQKSTKGTNDWLRRLCFLGVVVCLGGVATKAAVPSRVTITVASTGEVRVEAELSSPQRSWSFRNAYAGVLGIAERIEGLRAVQGSGQEAGVKKIATGEFRSDVGANRISYTVRLPTPTPADVAHVSWLVGDRGFLMFADLIPRDVESLSATFILPPGWTVESSITPDVNGHYTVLEPEKAVFFTGRSLRKTSNAVEGMILDTVLSGTWSFKDADASKAATRVMKKYLALTGFKLPGKSTIMIAPLPVSVGSIKWRAETRGSTIVLLLDPVAAIKNW